MGAIATGLWSPVYDGELAWVGIRLETDAASVSSDFLARTVADLNALEGVGDKLFFAGAQVLAAGDTALPLPFPPEQVLVASAAADAAGGGVRILDAAALCEEPGLAVLQEARRSGAKLLVRGLDSQALFERCAAQGVDYFSFGRLVCSENRNDAQDTSRLPLMRLLTLVTRDADTAEMEAVFKAEPKLAFDLLRLVNSASLGVRTEITSFAQAILVLGRRQLQRWLQLLLFAHRKDGRSGPNILMRRAAERGRLMEFLAQQGNETADRDMAFMAGVFSVLDVLMATQLSQLLKSIALPQPVEQALLQREGRLGALLGLVCAAEEGNCAEVRRLLGVLGIDPGVASRLQLETIFWAIRIAGNQ